MSESVDLAAFLATAEYAILQAPHGSDHEASEALISAGCHYAPRLLAAVEAVLAEHQPVKKLTRLGPPAFTVCKACDHHWDPTPPVGCPTVQAIARALLGEGEST